MIVKILSRGKSFKGLATYLTHDPEAKTASRVGWTHTLNLANDHVPSAVDEMLWTARSAELLKQEAGIRAGGRATENAVKHLSLNWAPEDRPTPEHMIQATEEFLRHMNWQDHQALLVAHQDKDHCHVHAMLNVVHPETGLRLDDNFERRRAQAWALAYEREHGLVHCPQRMKDFSEREDAPTRPAWLAFRETQKSFEQDEKNLRLENLELSENPEKSKISHFADWKMLKQIQKDERENFFAAGKIEFSRLRSTTYREVREEFRDRWADFYNAQKNDFDADALATLKSELVAEQKALLEERRDAAYAELRQTRLDNYRELLDDQREIRTGMRWRQEAGLDNSLFLQLVAERPADRVDEAVRDDAERAAVGQSNDERNPAATAFSGSPREDNGRMKSSIDIGANLSSGIGFGLLGLFGSIADSLAGSTSAPKTRAKEPEPLPGPNPFEAAIDVTRKHQQREQQEADDEAWRKRQRSLGE